MKSQTTFKTIVPVAFLLLLLTSCGKKDDTEKAKSSLLTSSSWTVGAYQWRTVAGAWIDPPSWSTPYFYPGQVLAFADNGTLTVTFGGTGTAASATWLLSDDRKKLTVVWRAGGTDVIGVSSLTGSAMEFSGTLDSKGTYTIENQGTPDVKYTYYDAWRITLSH